MRCQLGEHLLLLPYRLISQQLSVPRAGSSFLLCKVMWLDQWRMENKTKQKTDGTRNSRINSDFDCEEGQ